MGNAAVEVFSLWSDPRLHNWEHFEDFAFGDFNFVLDDT
jgi:hypothetical protein